MMTCNLPWLIEDYCAPTLQTKFRKLSTYQLQLEYLVKEMDHYIEDLAEYHLGTYTKDSRRIRGLKKTLSAHSNCMKGIEYALIKTSLQIRPKTVALTSEPYINDNLKLSSFKYTWTFGGITISYSIPV